MDSFQLQHGSHGIGKESLAIRNEVCWMAPKFVENSACIFQFLHTPEEIGDIMTGP